MSEDTEQPESETAGEEAADKPQYSKAQPGARRRIRNFIRLGLMILGPLAVVIAGGYYYVIGGQFVSTENAYVKADKIAISTNVPGRVIESLFPRMTM